ncbi:amidohydrolase family protein [Gordonia sp. NPDC003425]
MTTLLRNAVLIDGTGADPIPDAVVIVDDGKITYAGPASGAPQPADGAPAPTTIDLEGNTLCPGFFDCHVHLSLPGTKGSPYAIALVPPAYRYYQLIDRLKVTLHAGVTTVRDLMGVDVGVRDAVAHGLVEGPRLLVAVNMLSQTAGHADFHLKSGVDVTAEVGGYRVDTVDEARKRARELIRMGVDVIKVASSGGVASPNDQPTWLGLREEAVAAIVEEGQNYGGVPVAAHAIGYPGIRAAVEAGVHSVEHGYDLDEELRAQMVEQGTFLIPTLLETMKDVTTSPDSLAKSKEWHEKAHVAVGESVAAGIRVGLGTDAGLSPDHGDSLKELALLVEFGGMTPLQAIVAGTKTSADLCGLGDKLGTVEAGKIADLVVVRGNPLDDIKSVGEHENILLVIKEGKTAINRGEFANA